MSACTYCGKQNPESATHCVECGTELSSDGASSVQKAPPLPPPQLIDVDAVGAAFTFDCGFHRADWNLVRQWVESQLDPADWEQAWSESALLWVSKLRDGLGGGYAVFQSRQTILLCDQSVEAAQWLLDYAGRAALIIKEQLGPTAWRGAFGRDAVLVFSEEDDYYQYVAHHMPDGVNPASGGMCIPSGYTHIALPWTDQFNVANVVIHELTHDCLAHLPIPVWLNEGVAVSLERAIGPPPRPLGQSNQEAISAAAYDWRAPVMWDELAERHFAFWNEENIQYFWAGISFDILGDSNELSYSLAQVFVKLLSERGDGQAFRAFLEAAVQDDAGQTAAMDILGADLGDIAGTFLGEGNWRPQRKAIKACWEPVAGKDDSQTGDSAGSIS
jgi:hypothetical protein